MNRAIAPVSATTYHMVWHAASSVIHHFEDFCSSGSSILMGLGGSRFGCELETNVYSES